jgi:serine O-acetyltransferase
MKFSQYVFLLRSDLHRYAGNSTFSSFMYHFVLSAGYRYSFWVRTCAYLHSRFISRFLLFPIAWLVLRSFGYLFGMSIPFQTQIGSGFYINRARGIVIHPSTVIGRNCNISHQVSLGEPAEKGQPVIGDYVYIGPRAKVSGNLRIGNHVAISADCVVTTDIPDQSVVFGDPGRVAPLEESEIYIYRTDYE